MKLRTVIATAATAAVLASSGVAIAGATTSTGSHTTPAAASSAPAASTAAPAVTRRTRARRLRLRALLRGAAGVVTGTIGIDRPTLRKDLRSGMTVAQIATANNADPQAVIQALVVAADKKLDAAVTAGRIRSARAARIEQRLPDRITQLVNTWHPKRVRERAGA